MRQSFETDSNGAVSPIWSADGRSILYEKREAGLFEKKTEGGSERVIEEFTFHSHRAEA